MSPTNPEKGHELVLTSWPPGCRSRTCGSPQPAHSFQPAFNQPVTPHSRCILHNPVMLQPTRPLLRQALSCWNLKCALLSAVTRSAVYLAAMSRKGFQGSLAVVLVEIAYVTLTAGVYAGMQQKALNLRPRLLGSLIITVGVPALAQILD